MSVRPTLPFPDPGNFRVNPVKILFGVIAHSGNGSVNFGFIHDDICVLELWKFTKLWRCKCCVLWSTSRANYDVPDCALLECFDCMVCTMAFMSS